MSISLPTSGIPAAEVLGRIQEMQAHDVNWRDGRAFAYVYYADPSLENLLQQAYIAGFSTNGLSPSAFPSLAQMEQEVIEMVGGLLGCPTALGSMTSGGSESIFLAVKTARDRARALHPEILAPRLVLPMSAHPAFSKAAQLLTMETTRVPVDHDTLTADTQGMADAVSSDVVLLVASAPSYPHGVVDPIEEIAALAASHDIPLHVDACVGGMFLPFAKKLGRRVPKFDLATPGVASISVDLHKFGYAAKGASLVLYRNSAYFAHQPFVFGDWSGGHYSAPNLAGTRPGGAIAAAWASLNYLGEQGYLELTRRALTATDALIVGIEQLPGLRVIGSPDATLIAIGSETLSLGSIVNEMRRRGWVMSLQGPPASIHMTVTASHDRVTAELLLDLGQACSPEYGTPDEQVPGYN